ncbi:glycerol-3-phosphate phosphatase [Drosophila tropicalis]|uniref:glycerol-3-phosphate phosphatase n=1 Tax=Drosophila tropicalis TaxID=46794 RepID=UPI0035AB6860
MSVGFNRNIVQKGCCKLLTLNRHSIQQWLQTFETIIFDADGVIWKNEVPLTGAPETFNALRAAGKKAFICTNHSSTSALGIWQKAQRMGLLVAKDEVLSSSQAAARYLKEKQFQRKVYIIGGQGIADELKLVGIESLFHDEEKSSMTSMLDYVQNLKLDSKVGAIVVGMDKYFNVSKLTKAGCYLMDSGVLFIATNRDLASPVTQGRFTLSSGIMVASIEAVAKRAPITCGKPNPYICSHLIRQGVIKPERTLMVGDNIHTDVQFGYNCGFQTLLVGTGINSLADISQAQAKASKVPFLYQQIPDLFIPKLSDLLPFLSSRNR